MGCEKGEDRVDEDCWLWGGVLVGGRGEGGGGGGGGEGKGEGTTYTSWFLGGKVDGER